MELGGMTIDIVRAAVASGATTATAVAEEHYARIAEMDVEQAHRRASPADNWHL